MRFCGFRASAVLGAVILGCVSNLAVAVQPLLPGEWPAPGDLLELAGESVTFPSQSPFVIADVADGSAADEATTAEGMLFMPPVASTRKPVPAVILLHGSGGVISARELTYGRQFAAMGVAALVVDAFSPRRDRWNSFVERLLNVTETMLMADAYAGLDYLAARGDIDPERVVLMGFSYGAMASTYAVFRTVADRLARGPERFVAHVAFYGPCIAEFEDERTTKAPLLMAIGALDAITDRTHCGDVAAELERGGTRVEFVVYEGAYHQWDGRPGADWHPGRGLADCRFEVEADGTIRDTATWLPMTNYYTRAAALGLCSDDAGYRIKTDEGIRRRSNAAVSDFLNRAWADGPTRR